MPRVINIDALTIFTMFFLYPLFLKIEILDFRVKSLFLIFILLVVAVKFISSNEFKVDERSYILLAFSLWLVIILLRNLYIDFQEYNILYKVESFFQTNVDEYLDNYYNIGNVKHNVKYYMYMIIFIPFSYILGYKIPATQYNLKITLKAIFFFLIIFSIFILKDVLAHTTGTIRASGIYDNIGAAQEAGTVILMLFIVYTILNRSYRILNIYYSYLVTILAIAIISASNTRSVMITLFVFVLLYKKPKIMLIVTILFSIFLIFISLYLSDSIKLVTLTNMSSLATRMDLWNTYLAPVIMASPFWGFGTIPGVTENWIYFILGVTGFIGTILFFIFLFRKYNSNRNNLFLLFVSIILFQGNIYMGALGNDLLPLTFFILGYLSKIDSVMHYD